jgi:hypothetical protein
MITIREADYPIIVSLRGQEYPLSRRFIYDVVYGFETVQSCARGLLLFAHDLAAVIPLDLPDLGDRKPRMWYADNVGDVSTLLGQADVSESDYVSMPQPLARLLARSRHTTRSGQQSLAVMRIDHLRKLFAKSGHEKAISKDSDIEQ